MINYGIDILIIWYRLINKHNKHICFHSSSIKIISRHRWQDFIEILDDVGDLVASQLRRLSSASVAVRAAAKAMGCGVERVLLGPLEMQNPRCCC